MGIIEKLVLFPSKQLIPLLDPLILLMLLFCLAFTGGLLISAILSLLMRAKHPRIARDCIDLTLRQPIAGLIFGLVPLLTLVFLYAQYLPDAAIPIGTYLLRVTTLCCGGILLLILYRRTLHPLIGLPGVLLLLGSTFHLIATLDLVLFPEKWQFIHGPLPFLFSIQAVIHFLIFIGLSLVLTGSGLLLVYFRWPERSLNAHAAEEPLLRGLGLGAILIGALKVPPLLLWDYYTAPSQVLASDLFTLGFLMMIALFLIAGLTLAMIGGRHARHSGVVLLLALLAVGLFAAKGRTGQSHANQEHEVLLKLQATANYEELTAQREALYASSHPVDERMGERLYEERCTACHAFDRRVVGPPHQEVLPKYVADPDALADFILKPERINRDYPPMPNQGLRRSEARAVALYLIKRFTGEEPETDGSPDAGGGEH